MKQKRIAVWVKAWQESWSLLLVPEVPHQNPKALGIIIPWRRDKLPTTAFLGFPGSSVGKEWVSEVAQSCLTLCNPMDCSLLGSFIHGIFQTRVLEWVVSKESACKAGDLGSWGPYFLANSFSDDRHRGMGCCPTRIHSHSSEKSYPPKGRVPVTME